METNKTNLIPEEELKNVAGGIFDPSETITASDGRQYPRVSRYDSWCPSFHCKRCSGNYESHASHCRLSESIQQTCYACAYFELLDTAKGGTGCCRRG